MTVTRQNKIIITILITGVFFVVLNQTLLSPAMPTLMEVMDVDSATIQWLTSGYSLVESVVIPLNAFLLGKVGARRLFCFGMIVFVAGSLVCAIAPSFFVLMVGRVFQALATGALVPSVFTVILLIFPKEKRGSAMGLICLIIGIAPAIGPVISGFLVDSIGWRYEFVLVAVFAVIIDIVAFAKLRDIQNFPSIGFDLLSIILLAVGMIFMLFGLSTVASAEQLAVPLVMIVAGAVFLALFCHRQFRLDVPILKIASMKARRFATAVVLILVIEGLVIASSVLFPIYAQNALGISATKAGLLMFPGIALGTVLGMFAGRFFDKHGARGICLAGSALLLIGFGGYLFCGQYTPVILVCVIYAVACLGINSLLNPINTWGLNALPNEDVPHGNAILSTIEQIGASLGTGLVVGLTALGTSLAGAGATQAAQAAAGCHVSFIALEILAAIVVLGIIIFVRDDRKN